MSAHPQRLRLLLYLEWVLLAVITCGELVRGLNILPRLPILNGIGLMIFALMGLHLPQRQGAKLLYILIEIGLLLVTSLVGGLRLIGLWFVIMVIRNSQFLQRPYRIGVMLLAFTVFVALQVQRRHTLNHLLWLDLIPEQMPRLWLGWMLMYGLILVFLQLLVDTLLSEYDHRHRLSLANEQIRQYAAQVEVLATTQERNRIARDIHDALGHSLTALAVHLEAVHKLWPVDPAQARTLLSEAQELAQTALKDVRQSVATLRSPPLATQSLTEAIATLLQDLNRTHRFRITSDLAINSPVPPAVKTAVYRILQEALTNIVKHSGATSVTLKIQTQDMLQVLIQDNGVGFDLGQNASGFGLHSMRERALALNGSFAIDTAPNQGCQICLSFPLTHDP